MKLSQLIRKYVDLKIGGESICGEHIGFNEARRLMNEYYEKLEALEQQIDKLFEQRGNHDN